MHIDSPPWGPDTHLATFDAVLRSLGSTQLNVTMENMPLEDDGDHFTRDGQRAFSSALARALRSRRSKSILVMADSTVDFHDWSDEHTRTGWASSLLATALGGEERQRVVVDAISGSGFIARAHHGEHFHARLSRHLRGGFRGDVLLIGGWNDARTGRVNDTIHSIHKCASLIDRYARNYAVAGSDA